MTTIFVLMTVSSTLDRIVRRVYRKSRALVTFAHNANAIDAKRMNNDE